MFAVTLHSGLGSMSEAMQPQSPVVVATEQEAKDIVDFFVANDVYGESDARYFELPEPMTLEQAKQVVSESYLCKKDY